jgi:hydrogenase expression/formation protein HypC
VCLGIPGRIVDIVDVPQQRVTVDVEGARREVSVALLGLAADPGGYLGSDEPTQLVDVGDWVLIHVGFAMSRIDEAEAAETLRALGALGGAYEQELEEFSVGGPMDPLEILGLPDPPSGGALVSEVCEGPVCITCSDQGERAMVLESDGVGSPGPRGGGEEREVDVTLVDPLQVGDAVLLHAGIAITRLDTAAARDPEVTP